MIHILHIIKIHQCKIHVVNAKQKERKKIEEERRRRSKGDRRILCALNDLEKCCFEFFFSNFWAPHQIKPNSIQFTKMFNVKWRDYIEIISKLFTFTRAFNKFKIDLFVDNFNCYLILFELIAFFLAQSSSSHFSWSELFLII